MMRGWKTWFSAVCLGVLACIDLYNGGIESATSKASAAIGLIGLGHKIEKASCSQVV